MAMASEKMDPLSHGPLRKGVGGIAVAEPSSWAEIMHRQTSSNRNRPRPDAEYAMPFRETRYAKSRDEVVYNPVLQKAVHTLICAERIFRFASPTVVTLLPLRTF